MKKQKKQKKDHYLTFLVVPHGSSNSTVSFRLKYSTFIALCCLIAVLIGVCASSFVYSATLSKRLITYKLGLETIKAQKNQLSYFSLEATQLRESIKELSERDNDLRRLLGLKKHDAVAGLNSVVISDERKFIDERVGLELGDVYGDFKKAEVDLAKRKESLADLQKTVSQIRQRFANTPSVWPAYGRIVSGYGYRYFPWRGFHTGVDISAWYGAPVRATASGKVIYSGWRGGYGKTVVIDHGSGLSTLYGHNSKLTVSVGQTIRKGQVISYVGTSGFSTGPHCHYEVRRNDKHINPVAYLGLDIFTASKTWNR
ncbi:MAG: peptidoglycan DD-metalloendopeptidase family protein [Candidatus Margulisbacteria bacterium]|nr:peptidoglycan DD-metalloendopeptidase family protein [Candidatus Margulisiibacteriota bacterium]MBU1021056.1 peptidoglycan DD-metalloendopeptidase family protein [Candidatus Margulisiibacteriota bacterium]MBU1729731.1 peptidoglycan DD-metalloendopeptidase family protein [Candidatus Margulisiibacteriota bacterium]MBU1955996.1 peptidoglycan DD-metalloendopeptidase family protein [Candidatus Margulisiibacteriota bacterium]